MLFPNQSMLKKSTGEQALATVSKKIAVIPKQLSTKPLELKLKTSTSIMPRLFDLGSIVVVCKGKNTNVSLSKNLWT